MAKNDIPEIRQNSIGFVFTFSTHTDLTSSTNLQLIIKTSSSRKVKNLTTANITNAANGEVSYTAQEGDLSDLGSYSLQIIDVTDGIFLPSDVMKFKVVENL